MHYRSDDPSPRSFVLPGDRTLKLQTETLEIPATAPFEPQVTIYGLYGFWSSRCAGMEVFVCVPPGPIGIFNWDVVVVFKEVIPYPAHVDSLLPRICSIITLDRICLCAVYTLLKFPEGFLPLI